MKDKDLKNISEQIFQLSAESQQGINLDINAQKIFDLVSDLNLNLDDLLLIDNYIQNNLITKE